MKNCIALVKVGVVTWCTVGTAHCQLSDSDAYQPDPSRIKDILTRNEFPGYAIDAAIKATLMERDSLLLPGGRGKASRRRPIVRTPPEAELQAGTIFRVQLLEYKHLTKDVAIPPSLRRTGYESMNMAEYLAVQNIEDEFAERDMRTMSIPTAIGALNSRATLEARNMQFLQSVSSALSSQSALTYLRVCSSSARTVQRRLSGQNVQESDYNRLVDFTIKIDCGMYERRSRAERDLCEMYVAVLGAERFLKMAIDIDSVAASADPVYLQKGASANARVRLFISAHEMLMDLGAGPSNSKTALEAYSAVMAMFGFGQRENEMLSRTPLGQVMARFGRMP